MAEATFAKQFLTALESRPIKLSSDHVADARKFPPQSTYTLPRPATLPPQKRKRPAPSDEFSSIVNDTPSNTATPATAGIKITFKPLRGATVTLPELQDPSTTSVYALKAAYAAQAGVDDASRVKLLYARRAQPDSRTLAEVFAAAEGEAAPADGGEATFSVVVSGAKAGAGAPSTTGAAGNGKPDISEQGGVASTPAEAPVAQGMSGPEVLRTDAFWNDLGGFLEQRVRDQAEAGRLTSLFKTSWEGRG